MGYRNKSDIFQDIKKELKAMECFGQSKHAAKQQYRKTHNDGKAINLEGKIFSYGTAKTYNKECQLFAEYVAKTSPKGRYTTICEAKEYAKEYIQQNNISDRYSASTVKMQASALGKLFRCRSDEFGKTESRKRENIERSRNRTIISKKTGNRIKNPSTRAGHFSEKNHKEIVDFAKSTGLRKCELESICGNQLKEIDGKYYIEIKGNQSKGGKERNVPIHGNVEEVIKKCREAGEKKVFQEIPKSMDVHHYRQIYAMELYKSLEQDLATLERKEKYFCRLDQAGVAYDRKAMEKVSKALGHNRISVIAGHYLIVPDSEK